MQLHLVRAHSILFGFHKIHIDFEPQFFILLDLIIFLNFANNQKSQIKVLSPNTEMI